VGFAEKRVVAPCRLERAHAPLVCARVHRTIALRVVLVTCDHPALHWRLALSCPMRRSVGGAARCALLGVLAAEPRLARVRRSGRRVAVCAEAGQLAAQLKPLCEQCIDAREQRG
jgi:hypothetical protein